MRPNKSLGRIKVFCNVEIWIFLVWIIPQQSSVSPPSKALVYRPTSLLWSLIGQMVTFTNAWPWVRSRVESYLTTPKAFAILAETSTVPGTETWVSTEKHSLLVKRIEAGCLCVMGENTQQLPRNSQERRLRGARSVLPSSIRQRPSWPFHNCHFSSKEKKDGGAMHLGGGGENSPSLVRGLCLQDSQRSDGTLLHAVLCKLNLDYILSCSMSTTMLQVMFFLAATVKLQEDDNACLWIPTFLVPAFLSTIVAVNCK